MSKAEINRYSAAFFFLQAVGVDAGQCLDQRGFAMVNVAGGAEDDGFHCWSVYSAVLEGALALSL
jgi:hypothetical protein